MDLLNVFTLILFAITWQFTLVQGFESLLIRTKRKPFSENEDYIDQTRKEIKEKEESTKSVRAQRNILGELVDHSVGKNTPAENVFKRLVDKSDLRTRKVGKRYVGGHYVDPYRKLKDFFDELKKRSIDEEAPDDNVKSKDSYIHLKIALEDLKNGQYESKRSMNYTNVTETTSENDDDHSGSGESGSAESGDESIESASGSGFSSGMSEFIPIKRSLNDDDYEELFISEKKKVDDVNGKIQQRNKRELDEETEEGNPEFEGLPERLAIINRENPRVKILKREAIDQNIPDIPLPFNHINQESSADTLINNVGPEINQNVKNQIQPNKKQLISHKEVLQQVDNGNVNSIPYSSINTLDVIKRSLDEENLKNVRIINDKKARSIFDTEEGDFLKHIKRDGVYYDSRSERFLISAKADELQSTQPEDEKNTIIKATNKLKRNVEKENNVVFPLTKKQSKGAHKTKRDVGNATEEISKIKKKDSSTNSTSLVNSVPLTFQSNNTNRKSHINQSKSGKSVKGTAANDSISIQNDRKEIKKRDILSDDDPNIDYLMRYDGKTEEVAKTKINREVQKRNILTAEEVYKFARSVMNLVDDNPRKKTKRHIESPAFTGVWSGLGTAPVFVPGLIKRDYADTNSTNYSNKTVMKRHVVDHNDRNKENSSKIILKRKATINEIDGLWTSEHGSPVFSTAERQIGKSNQDFDESEEGNNSYESNEELPLLSKRGSISTDKDDFHELLKRIDREDTSSTDLTGNGLKIKRDINEQGEAKQMEIGSLGAINMIPQTSNSVTKRATIIFKPNRESLANQTERNITKRSNLELDKDIKHLATTPVHDGNVVLAFDEVKELLPTKRFFSKDEEQMLEPEYETKLIRAQPRMTITRATEKDDFDVDKDLAESMVLSADTKRSNIYGLTAKNVFYQNNEVFGLERSNLRGTPSLLHKNDKLRNSQLSKLLTEEVTPKLNEVKKWANTKNNPELSETDKRIQEVSDQLAESTAELEKLKQTNKVEEDSSYLAKKLEQKNTLSNDTKDSREEKFHKLQQQILDEQSTYRNLLKEQRRQYEENMLKQQNIINNSTSTSTNEEMNDPTSSASILPINQTNSDINNNSNLPTGEFQQVSNNIAANANNPSSPPTQAYDGYVGKVSSENHQLPQNQENESPFKAAVHAPKTEEINFDNLDPGVGDYHDHIMVTPQVLEHIERVHNPPASYNTNTISPISPSEINQSQIQPISSINSSETLTMLPIEKNISNNVLASANLNSTITTTISPQIISNSTQASTTPSPNLLSIQSSYAPITTVTTKVNKVPTISTTLAPVVSTLTTTPIPTNVSTSVSISNTSQQITIPEKIMTTNIPLANATSNGLQLSVNTTQTSEKQKEEEKPINRIKNDPVIVQPKILNITSLNYNNDTSNIKDYLDEKNTSKPLQENLSGNKSESGNKTNSTPDLTLNGQNTSNVTVPQQPSRLPIVELITQAQNNSISANKLPSVPNKELPNIPDGKLPSNFSIPLPKINEEINVINKTTASKVPFPLEIVYQPKIVKNMTKKKLEIEPRADGYIGCYIDHLVQGRDLPIRAGIPLVTPKNCRNACKKTGYKYAGLQYGYLCFCGNNYGKYDIVPDSECVMACSGNESFTCGGLWRNEIFDTEHVKGSYNGNVPYYLPSKNRQSMEEVPGSVKSKIPGSPITVGEEMKLLDNIQYSEKADIKALEEIKSDAMNRNTIGNVRNVGNFTDQDLINAAALELKMSQAEQNDIHRVNRPPNLNPTPFSATETLSDNHNDNTKELVAFTYLHPQKVENEEAQHSPVLPLKIEPGTHLFRGEITLHQMWYDDLAKPNSIKYNILSGNIEQALKNVFANDSLFLKAEVMSLREDGGRTPHRTIADFTMTFRQNTTTGMVTSKLFESVAKTNHLDGMPVAPTSLKIKEYLLDINAKAFIPKLINGQMHLDTTPPIDLNHSPITTSSYLQSDPSANRVSKSNIALPPISQLNTVSYEPPQVLSSKTQVKLNPAVQPHIRPIAVENTAKRNNIPILQNQPLNLIQKHEDIPVKETHKKKVPYVLRMFFWKDMLARKKRENNFDELERYKNKAKIEQKTVKFPGGLPIIRERREQADEWPIVYKTDNQKRGHNSKYLKRKKRVIEDDFIEKQDGYETLFKNIKQKNKRSTEQDNILVKKFKSTSTHLAREKRSEHQVLKKELISNSIITGLADTSKIITLEKEIHRSKRNNEEESLR